jgi:Rrf2 family protein
MYVSKEVDYALRAMIVLAAKGGQSLTDREISKAFKIPYNFLALVLPKLMRQGLVTLEKGDPKREAYRLVKKPAAVSVLDVVKAVNGPIDLIALSKADRGDAGTFGPAVAMWDGLAAEIEKYLAGVTLASCPLSGDLA